MPLKMQNIHSGMYNPVAHLEVKRDLLQDLLPNLAHHGEFGLNKIIKILNKTCQNKLINPLQVDNEQSACELGLG